MSAAMLVITTTPNRDLAERIAYELVERRQAGCVQITGPTESTYRWQDRMEIAREEWICTAKTMPDRYEAVEATIRELHSYRTPEIIAVPVMAGSADYLSWLRESVEPAPAPEIESSDASAPETESTDAPV